MLRFFQFEITTLEVPGEICLTFHLTGCTKQCPGCFSPWLQGKGGDPLGAHFTAITTAYLSRGISCICFLGEGTNTVEDHREFAFLCDLASYYKLKVCLYSGRDCQIENWMYCFDYIKLGSYQMELGPLGHSASNQKLYKRCGKVPEYEDITNLLDPL